jgi:ATP-dependent Clp protease, protease subunit
MAGRLVKDWDAVNAYFNYGLDAANRRVFLLDDVEDNSVGNAVKGIYYLASQDDCKPIELFIGSFGGSEYEMFALYDVLNSITCPITTVAIGKCMSAAPLLIASGTKGSRYSMPNTQWMIHIGSIDPGEREKRYDEIEKEVKHYAALNKNWSELMAKHTSRTAKQWTAISKQVGDLFFDAAQAIEYGLIDEIWDERNGE